MDTLVNRILYLAEEVPDRLAVAFEKEQLTYRELAGRMCAAAAWLREQKVQKGDRVLFSAVSKPEMVVIYLAIQYIGAVAVFIDKVSTPENAAAIYQEAEAVLFLTDKPMKGYEEQCRIFSLRRACQEKTDCLPDREEYQAPREEDMAEILFTTGTTGKAKGVILSYRAIYHILSNTIKGIGIREDDRILLPLPLNHSFALRVLRAALYSGAAVILQNGFAFARKVEENQINYHCTAMAAVPASMEILSGQMGDKFSKIIGKFRYVEIGAGSLTIEQRRRFTSKLPQTTIYNTWGSSETGGALFLNVTEMVSDPVKAGAVGRPLPWIEVKVIGENGKEICSDRDHPGRMALKGGMEMSGYWKQEEETKKTLRNGWLLTSDMVYRDSDGYVYMLGRADDIINVGGDKVSPNELENIAGQYEHIRECACIGVPDEKGILGQVPVLFVVAKDQEYSEADLQTFLAKRMERWKLPAHLISIQEIPRNRMQKTDRRVLKKLWEERGRESLMNPVMQAILTRRSIRKFTEEPIPFPILEMILQAGCHAPTGRNMQTWRFTVLTDKAHIAQLKEATVTAAGENQVFCYGFENPVCLILISNDERNRTGCQDAACAAENIFLAAHSYGIGSVWLNPLMTLRRIEPVKTVLDEMGIPENHKIWCMAALGYPVAEGKRTERRKDVVQYVDETI